MQLPAPLHQRGMLNVNLFLEQNGSETVCETLHGSGFVVYGARSSGKSSFAMQLAVNAALKNERVVVLCNEHILMQKVPKPFTPLDSLAPETLSHIEFLHVGSTADIFRQLALISREEDFPSVILVDDGGLGDVEESGGGTLVLAVLSALINTSEWLNRHQPSSAVPHGKVCIFAYTTNALNEYSDTSRIGQRISHIFPVVSLHFSGSGSVVVSVEPTPFDDVELSSIHLQWTSHGITLR